MKVIDYDQTTFIPVWFIKKKNMLIQFVFLKFDFAQASNKMN